MKKILTLIIVCITLFCACAAPSGTRYTSEPTASPAPSAALKTDASIVSLAPSITRTLISLGVSDRIIGCDTTSASLAGLNLDIPQFDMMSPDPEKLLELKPDIILASSLSFYENADTYKPLKEAGIKVIEIPAAQSFEEIRDDITYLAELTGEQAKGQDILKNFNAKIKEFVTISAEIPPADKKSVYFEISPAPDMYSTGSSTYLNEMIEAVGGKNVFADETGWMSVSGEAVVKADPDVIFTNVDYNNDPIGEILSRKGWAEIKAIKDSAVYSIDKDSSSEPNEDIIKAMVQMAKALYPEYYDGI